MRGVVVWVWSVLPVAQGPAAARVGSYFATGLQDFVPEEGRYDLIWCQWVLSHLTDGEPWRPALCSNLLTSSPPFLPGDLVSFLRRCAAGLADGGAIVLKENTAEGEGVHDEVDSSVTRTQEEFMAVFQQAGQQVVLEQRQTSFPQELFPVYM